MTLDIPKLLDWGKPGPLELDQTTIMVRRALVPPQSKAFWNIWREQKEELTRLGVFVRLHNKVWMVFWKQDEPAPEPRSGLAIAGTEITLPAFVRKNLRDYQVEPVETMLAQLQTNPRILNGSDMGTGKTYVALAVCACLKLKPVAVCRIAAKPAWQEVAELFGLEIIVANREKIKTGNTKLGYWAKNTFIWTLPKNSLLILDEVHADGAINGSKNSLMLRAVRDQGMHALALSASAASSPLKMRALGHFLGLHNWFDFYPWLYKHGCEQCDYGFEFNCGLSWGQRSSMLRFGGQTQIEKLQREVMSRIHADIFEADKGVRVRKSEIPNFPRTTIIPVRLQFDTAKINKIYEEMEAELAELADKEKGDQKGQELIIMTRARQKTELLKVPGIISDIEEAIEENQSVAIFCNYKETVAALAERLKTNCLVTGDQSPAEKQKAMADFQSNRSRVIVCNNQAGGESISLHCLDGVYARLAIIFPSFWAESILQCTGRVDRDGGKLPSIQKILFAAGTVEERAYQALCGKLKNIQSFNGDLGITDFDLR